MIDIEHPEKYQTRDGAEVVALYKDESAPSSLTTVLAIYKEKGKHFSVVVNQNSGTAASLCSGEDIIPKPEWEYRCLRSTPACETQDIARETNLGLSWMERRPKGSEDPKEWERFF